MTCIFVLFLLYLGKTKENDKMNKISIICSFFLLISASALSQPNFGTISGSVIDKATNKPIESADVSLIGQKDSVVVSGASTDASGKYMLNNLPRGRFFIRANIVGYNFGIISGIVISNDNPNISLDPIKLSQSGTTTEEIVVEDQKSLIEFKPDKRVFNVSQNLTTQGGTLLDLLKEVPSVVVDQDGNVSLRGSEGVKITIDGRSSGLEGQNRNIILEQIPASDVDNIELITNPSAKYEAEGTVGIINIVLKKNEQTGFGYNGTLGLNAGTGDKYNGQLSLNLRNKNLSFYGNYAYDLRNFNSNGFNDRSYFGESLISGISQLDSGHMRGKNHLLKLGMDYSIDKNNIFGLSMNYRNSSRTSGSTSFYNEYDMSNNLLSDFYTSSSSLDKGYNLDLNADYKGTFGKNKQVLSAELSFSRDKDDESEINADTYIFPSNNTPDKRNEYSNELDDEYTGKIDYEYPVSKDIKIESGYKGNYIKRDIDFRVENYDYRLNQFITDYNQSNEFIFKQQVHALYGIYTQQLGNFGYSLGVRAEQTYIKGELQTNGQSFDKNYIDFFPSASISEKLAKSSEIQLSYSRRVHRPRHNELNPFRSYMGSNSYRQGNPDLDPELTDSYELNFIQYFPWATITPGIFYRYTKNEISPYRTLLDSITTLTMPVNLNSSKSYGGELIISSQPVKFITFNGTFSYYRTDVDANNYQSGTNSASSWSARAMSGITLPANFMLQLSYFYRGKRVTAQGTMLPFQSFDAAIKKELFDKRLSISLRVNDIFNNAKFRVEFYDPSFSEIMERRRDTRTVSLNITYNFGQKENPKQDRRKKKNEDNNNENGEDYEY